jgi:hypothetical protein
MPPREGPVFLAGRPEHSCRSYQLREIPTVAVRTCHRGPVQAERAVCSRPAVVAVRRAHGPPRRGDRPTMYNVYNLAPK